MQIIHPTDFEMHLFHEGRLNQSYSLFGAHLVNENGILGTRFCVWAPHAKEVHLVGSFNNWDGHNYSMEKITEEGIWKIVIPSNLANERYKYEIVTSHGEVVLKSDPYGFYTETRPNNASIVYDLRGYQWKDKAWISSKLNAKKDLPLSIYEVHVGSWKRKGDGTFYTYKELATRLIPYVKELGFTHIELLPITEHPLDKSWGYQGVGYYSTTSRYGSPHDLMFFIDCCHQNDIGVILDWVPGHFCKDSHGLFMFDGAPVFEYDNFLDRENVEWGTVNFDLGKPEVQNFLISNVIFWIDMFHIDGFRIDAVANMLYKQNRKALIPNKAAISFIKKLNQTIKEYSPATLMIAEDSTDWPFVTRNVIEGGLGFSHKWNMGWMNDVLTYMKAKTSKRQQFHHKITFSLLYAFSEKYILPFSHDEVVHGKKSLLNKMPGEYWEKFAQLRLLYGYLMTHPGKKLLFMGGEFGQFSEWNDQSELDWKILNYENHHKLLEYFKALQHFYLKSKPLFERDFTSDGFEWIDVNNAEQSIFSFIRKGMKKNDFLIIVCNFTNKVYKNYNIGVPIQAIYEEAVNSDENRFGGYGNVNSKLRLGKVGTVHGKPKHITVTIPPFGITIFRPKKIERGVALNGKEKMCGNAFSWGKGKSFKFVDKKLSKASSSIWRKISNH